MVDCGVISRESGQWEGVTTSDPQMMGITIGLGIANTGEFLVPDTNEFPSIDMTGYKDILIAVKTTRAGNYAFTAVMGPATEPFGGLTPVDAAATLVRNGDATIGGEFESAFSDSQQALTADVWNIFLIGFSRLQSYQNMQFKIVNNAGGDADMEFAFMRIV